MTENRHNRRSIRRALALPRPSMPQVLLVFLALLALAVQSFVVQTHIHIPQVHGRAQTVSLITLAATAVADKAPVTADASTPAPHDKYPINEDPSNCPLCQEVAHSGQYVTSAAALAALPFSVTVNFVVFNEALPSFLAASHIWQGRAPPTRS